MAAGGRLPQSTAEASPASVARWTGLLLIIMALAAGFAELGVRAKLVVPGDAVATAARIVASPRLFRLGFLGYLVAFLCDVPVAILFYVLLRPVGDTLALTAAAFRLVYAAMAGANLLRYVAALVVLTGGASVAALPPEQRSAFALLSLTLFQHGSAWRSCSSAFICCCSACCCRDRRSFRASSARSSRSPDCRISPTASRSSSLRPSTRTWRAFSPSRR